MIVAIHQPNYLPWMGYFDKMRKADVFVILDDVQLPRGGHSYETRAVIQSAQGPLELNVPVERRGSALIKDTRLAAGRWRSKHLKSILLSYPEAPICQLAGIYERARTLLDLNLAFIRLLVEWLDIRTDIVLSSGLGVEAQGTDKILGIVKALGGDTYISGTGAGSRRYVDEETFAERGVKVVWHAWTGSNTSAIDSVFARQAVA